MGYITGLSYDDTYTFCSTNGLFRLMGIPCKHIAVNVILMMSCMTQDSGNGLLPGRPQATNHS